MLVRQSADEINQDILADRIKQIKASFEESSFVVASSQPKISWKYLSDGLRVLPFEINLNYKYRETTLIHLLSDYGIS